MERRSIDGNNGRLGADIDLRFDFFGREVDGLERVEHGDAVGEDAVRQEERVQEVDREEPQVRQTLQKTLRRGVPHLRHLQGTHSHTACLLVLVSNGVIPRPMKLKK